MSLGRPVQLASPSTVLLPTSGSIMMEARRGDGSHGLLQPSGINPLRSYALSAVGVLRASVSQWRELSPASRTPRGPWCAPTPTEGGLSPGLRVARGGPGRSRDAQSCPAQLLFCFNKSAAAGPAQPPACCAAQAWLAAGYGEGNVLRRPGRVGCREEKNSCYENMLLMYRALAGLCHRESCRLAVGTCQSRGPRAARPAWCSVPCSPAQPHRATANSSDHPQPSPCCSPKPTRDSCSWRRVRGYIGGLSDCMLLAGSYAGAGVSIRQGVPMGAPKGAHRSHGSDQDLTGTWCCA